MSFRSTTIFSLFLVIISCGVYGNTSCPSGSVVVSWSPWVCNRTALTSSRTGTCNGTNTQVIVAQPVSLITWTSWSSWLPSCGLIQRQEQTRDCLVPAAGTPYCSDCGDQNLTQSSSRSADLPPCCEDQPYGAWSPWSPGCADFPVETIHIEQSRGRSRECFHSRCLPCPLDVETRRAVVQSWSKWGEWSGTLRPCSEKTYRRRSRSCPAPTNPQGYPVYSCCNSTSDDVEYSCCGSVYTLRNISCGSDYCLWECYNKTSPISLNAPSPLIKDPYVCLEDPPTCDHLGDTRNISITIQSSTETPPPVPVFIWPIIVLSVTGAIALVVVGVIILLCWMSYKKYKHSYQLMSRRKQLEGVYGHIALGSSTATSVAPSSTREQREDQEDFWTNPLHSTGRDGRPYENSYYGDEDNIVDGVEKTSEDGKLEFEDDGRGGIVYRNPDVDYDGNASSDENASCDESKDSYHSSLEQVDVASHQEWVKFDKGKGSDEEGVDSEQEVFEI